MSDLMKSKGKELTDLIATQTLSVTGNIHVVNEYMRGMANGLICAKSVLLGGEPDYLEAIPRQTVEKFHDPEINLSVVVNRIDDLYDKVRELFAKIDMQNISRGPTKAKLRCHRANEKSKT